MPAETMIVVTKLNDGTTNARMDIELKYLTNNKVVGAVLAQLTRTIALAQARQEGQPDCVAIVKQVEICDAYRNNLASDVLNTGAGITGAPTIQE